MTAGSQPADLQALVTVAPIENTGPHAVHKHVDAVAHVEHAQRYIFSVGLERSAVKRIAIGLTQLFHIHGRGTLDRLAERIAKRQAAVKRYFAVSAFFAVFHADGGSAPKRSSTTLRKAKNLSVKSPASLRTES